MNNLTVLTSIILLAYSSIWLFRMTLGRNLIRQRFDSIYRIPVTGLDRAQQEQVLKEGGLSALSEYDLDFNWAFYKTQNGELFISKNVRYDPQEIFNNADKVRDLIRESSYVAGYNYLYTSIRTILDMVFFPVMAIPFIIGGFASTLILDDEKREGGKSNIIVGLISLVLTILYSLIAKKLIEIYLNFWIKIDLSTYQWWISLKTEKLLAELKEEVVSQTGMNINQDELRAMASLENFSFLNFCTSDRSGKYVGDNDHGNEHLPDDIIAV
ncbi:MAG: hypothetical protein GY909_01205 [Oligoflexia bacterium]|nr:hypothetical protein [Oligoflexia bacterium]